MRFEQGKVCSECSKMGLACKDRKACEPVRTPLRKFRGIRLTSDGFDCALPLTIDSHSACSYECLYCFSDNTAEHAEATGGRAIGQTPLSDVEKLFAGDSDSKIDQSYRKALKYHAKNAAGYPCPVQLGGLCDPCDSIERNQGWLLSFIDLAVKYRQPVRMSTKGSLFLVPEYQKAIAQAPEQFWVAFSIISPDDELMKQVDRLAPPPSQRLETMKALSKLGVSTSLRLRPMIQGISDRKKGYKELIKRAADAGARSISYEVAFYPSSIPPANKWKYAMLDTIIGYGWRARYESFGRIMACSRPAHTWTEEIMHSVRDVAHDAGLVVGVSDPVWKQLSDYGCCCGISPKDKVFGNWERENATEAMVKARNSKTAAGRLIHFADINPPWAGEVALTALVNQGAGPKKKWSIRHWTWQDKLRKIWNNPSADRSPSNYFQGALEVSGKDSHGDLIYKYVGLKREHKKSEWDV